MDARKRFLTVPQSSAKKVDGHLTDAEIDRIFDGVFDD